MKTAIRRILISAQVGAMVALAPVQGMAATDQGSTTLEKVERGFSIGFDLVILRPLGAGRMFVGMGLMVPMSIFNTMRMPFVRDSAIYGESAQLFVVEPANFVFRRPLGEDFSGE
jgi:hypothetical protein